MSLSSWFLRAMLRRDGDLGVLRSASELGQWLHALPLLGCGVAADGARGFFVGTVVAGEEIVASPLSGAECVMARITCFRQQRDRYDQANEIEVGRPFRVRDSSGEAWVDPGLVSLLLDSAAALTLPEQHLDAASLVARDRGADGAILSLASYRYEERRIAAGDAIVLVGQMRHTAMPGDAGDGYRTSGRRAEIVCADDAMFLYVGDASLAPRGVSG